MNQKKRKNEEQIKDERSKIWMQIFINNYFKYAHRTSDERQWQIYGKYGSYTIAQSLYYKLQS